TMRFLRRCARTSSRVANSPLFWTISPLTLRAVYSKTGIVHLPPTPTSGARPPWRRPPGIPGRAAAHDRPAGPPRASAGSRWGADLGLLVRREDVDDAVDALRRGVGVQGREGEVSGLGDGERGGRCLEVAHLAHQHDVRVLPQGVLQGRVEAVGVGAHLALVDD